jgi:hypothetical protein
LAIMLGHYSRPPPFPSAAGCAARVDCASMIRVVRPDKPATGLPEIFGAVGLVLLLVARFVPVAKLLPGWGCGLRRLTGYPCLSCGMTRSFEWFARGRFADSFLINPLGFFLAALVPVGVLYLLLRPLRPPRLALELTTSQDLWLRVALLCVLAANWAYLLTRTFLARLS